MKLSLCILAFFMLAISIPINADQNTHLAAAERFLVISKEAEQNKQLLQQIQNQSKYDLQNMFKQSKVTDEQKHIYEKYRKRMMYKNMLYDQMQKIFSFEGSIFCIAAAAVNIFKSHLTILIGDNIFLAYDTAV